MATGRGMLELARRHIGEAYKNVLVPKNNANWHGPWDCAEFMSWLVFQDAGILYGCYVDDDTTPADAEAYTGAWRSDAKRRGIMIPISQAAAIPGAIVLRYPPAAGKMGHIAICDGHGGTVEAKGKLYGVVADKVAGRNWNTGLLIPGIYYDTNVTPVAWESPSGIYRIGAPGMEPSVVRDIQQALLDADYNPGPIDGIYGSKTAAAVAAYQAVKGLVSDGEVGPVTATALGIAALTPGGVASSTGGGTSTGDGTPAVGGADAPTTMSCSEGWYVTGFYTPGEEQFNGAATRIEVRGHGPEDFPADFLGQVMMEGWGLTRHGWYLGWERAWLKGDAALNARGGPLKKGSLAVDRSMIPMGTRVRIPSLKTPWDAQDFVADDTGNAIVGKHVDVYCGAGAEAEKETYRITSHNQRVCLG
jgi:N-acetylmuramoyl-L-alanine amidase